MNSNRLNAYIPITNEHTLASFKINFMREAIKKCIKKILQMELNVFFIN